ncbi:MAG: RNA polymerase subunit sigma-70 [Planctomycetes bacterium]|nr:RNA polymerase subunit sigma-70 [Planctomycetota bacterium]
MITPPPEDPGNAEPDPLASIYAELRAIAARLMAGERRSHTLQPTALVHEAWLRLADRSTGRQDPPGKALFATAMRNLLVDHARRKQAEVHGGKVRLMAIESGVELGARMEDGVDIIDLDDALRTLAEHKPDHARVAEMKLFTDMTMSEIASAIGKSKSTAESLWRTARAYLMRLLEPPDEAPPGDDRPV